ncbi:hypothetical protein H9L13_01655 [Sphingomonas lutea]|uniref:Ava_C0101 and related proteins n=1 Tax=Sphingomonas lutea TaxID=1045317 RepID=A0A7G9SIK2_9SPHN|nr:DUF5996 family protein [Sphingomonas lutea]QNN67677.1 hypothetical protein H9L13_01655 [Sphingomonas lutea]
MSDWPELRAEQDHETLTVLHLAAQMIGKIRVAHAPWVNHGWHVALQPNARGLASLPTAAGDGRTFTLTLDLCRHAVVLWVSDGSREELPLNAGSIAALYQRLVRLLDQHGLPSRFDGLPNEIEGAVPFAEDKVPRDYSRASAGRLREALAAMLPAFARFRAGFTGKASPVHFWWGSFDLAVTRFSGRTAPPHPGGVPGLPDRVTREAYSHEVSSAGFWAAGAAKAEPFFYSYAYPSPDGFSAAQVAHGRFDDTWGEFILPYDQVRAADDPDRMLGEFLQSTYDVAADLAKWDRSALERAPVAP